MSPRLATVMGRPQTTHPVRIGRVRRGARGDGAIDLAVFRVSEVDVERHVRGVVVTPRDET